MVDPDPIRDRLPARSVPAAIWEAAGVTQHLGGYRATEQLAARLALRPGEQVLDAGCGTGYTACYLAEQVQARVVGIDFVPHNLREARRRVERRGLAGRVEIVHADLHSPPLPDALFDAVITESVLVFCDAPAVLATLWRVLKPGGRLAANEVTFLVPPRPRLTDFLSRTLGMAARQQEAWETLIRQAGFSEVAGSAHPLRLGEQFRSHLVVDGPRRYLASMARGLGDPAVRATFFTREVLAAARDFAPALGYGLYVARRPAQNESN